MSKVDVYAGNSWAFKNAAADIDNVLKSERNFFNQQAEQEEVENISELSKEMYDNALVFVLAMGSLHGGTSTGEEDASEVAAVRAGATKALALTPQQSKALHSGMQQFFMQWKVHGRDSLQARSYIILQHFLVVVVSPKILPGGCARDELVRAVNNLAQQNGVRVLKDSDVFFSPINNDALGNGGHESTAKDANLNELKNGVSLFTCPRFLLSLLTQQSVVLPQTPMYSLAVKNLTQLETSFCVPALRGWIS